MSLYVNEDIKDEEDIRNLLIKTLDGKQLRIGDIARVEREYSEPQRNGFFVNGKPALAICMAVEQDAIVPDVGKAVDARLAEVTRDIPVGFHTEKIFFQPDKVDDAISSFMWNTYERVFVAEYQQYKKIKVQKSGKGETGYISCLLRE
ncbi:MAG TPA: efflux RND transporter permease subunit [Candidatus Bacteroides avicola]|uniref:Efflux RND transporter permease subunit n=1 Tax=Candidatus Bacteroides avicola TaxID=2838468 RepID=A0A9D2KUC9_9BACE|nr:efflux RND transporter permease subunit [Candidatus Bacteroides avicola]